MLALGGFGSMVLMAGSITLVQTMVDQDKRGRVMSIIMMAFMGLMPFGCMVAGWLASKIGAGSTVVISGLITVILAAVFATQIRQIELAQSNSAASILR